MLDSAALYGVFQHMIGKAVWHSVNYPVHTESGTVSEHLKKRQPCDEFYDVVPVCSPLGGTRAMRECANPKKYFEVILFSIYRA